MNKYEELARKYKSEGNLCSNALYKAFKEDLNLNEEPPKPRSIDGKCGTVLTTEFILKKIGKEKYYKEYEDLFLKEFGYLTCIELMRHERRCLDYVGFSANKIYEYMNKEL